MTTECTTNYEINPCIIVNNRLCKIMICQCNETNKKMYIRCSDIETQKNYSVFVSNSLFELQNFKQGDCTTIIDCTLQHISNYNYELRNKMKCDDCDENDPDGVTLYSTEGSNIIIGCYLKTQSSNDLILNYIVEPNKVTFNCKNIEKNKNTIHEIFYDVDKLDFYGKLVIDDFLEIGKALLYVKKNNYISCCDEENNSIEFTLQGVK